MSTKTQNPTQNKTNGLAPRAATGLVLLAAAANSQAAMDVSSVTASFTDAGAAAAVLGVAALLFAVGVVLWKRIRGAA